MTTAALDLELRRRFFADEIQAVANLRTAALVEAFARVPRERFLGPGPWQICIFQQLEHGYYETPDADPARVYHNVAIAIDPVRHLHNGHPSSVAMWLDELPLRAGERVLHVGAGVGYYTAILAEAVGPGGHVLAVEVDPALAARARANLADLAHVEVVCSGAAEAFPERDVIFLSAGATQPRAGWLDALAPGGRLLMPLTIDMPGYDGVGHMLRVERAEQAYAARFISPVQIFACAGNRDPDAAQRLREVYARGAWRTVRSLRRDEHELEATCVVHLAAACLSTR